MKISKVREIPTRFPKEKNIEVEDQESGNKSDNSPKGNDPPHQSNKIIHQAVILQISSHLVKNIKTSHYLERKGE
jgi:hypothetical protein